MVSGCPPRANAGRLRQSGGKWQVEEKQTVGEMEQPEMSSGADGNRLNDGHLKYKQCADFFTDYYCYEVAAVTLSVYTVCVATIHAPQAPPAYCTRNEVLVIAAAGGSW